MYAALWAAMVIIAGIALSRGNPELLAAPFDSTGKFITIKVFSADTGSTQTILWPTTIAKTFHNSGA